MAEFRRGAIYTRISRDLTGEGAGVRRQEEDCRALAAEHGIPVVAVFSDNDMSAYSSTPRPNYIALLKAIQDGAVDAVFVWHTDRLYRRMSDLEAYIGTCQAGEVPTFSVQSGRGQLDLTTPAGRMVARQLGSVAQYESEQKAERQRRANYQRALQGRHFGSKRCFGFELDGVTVRGVEAAAIHYAYQAVLDGVSLAAIARRWNSQGLRTPQAGNEWDSTVLGRTLRLARMAGMQIYKRSILMDAAGLPVIGEWPAIVDTETWHAVQAVLKDPKRSFPHSPQLLLSGVALCATCGAVMQSGGTRKGRHRYRCSGKGGHAYREAEPIDAFVTQVVLEYLRRTDIRGLITPAPAKLDTTDIRQQLAEVEQRASGLVLAFTRKTIDFQQMMDGQDDLKEQRKRLEARLPAPRNAVLSRLTLGPDPAVLWDTLDVAEKRGVIMDLLTVKVIATGGKEATYLDWRNRIINPESLILEWKRPTEEPQPTAIKRRRSVSRP